MIESGYMLLCKTCKIEKPHKEFPCVSRRSGSLYYRPTCWACKYIKAGGATRGRLEQSKEYMRSYYNSNKLAGKYKSYRSRHKLSGYSGEVISMAEAINIMMLPCFYCTKPECHGVDRIDNIYGYTYDNVRPCCEKCNNILGDIPDAAKLLLVEGLTKIYEKELLTEWQIPTKRAVRASPRGVQLATLPTNEPTPGG